MPDTIERNDMTVEQALAVCRTNGFICVEPRMSATDRADEAVDQIFFELGVLEGAIRSGGALSEQKQRKVNNIARRLLSAAGPS